MHNKLVLGLLVLALLAASLPAGVTHAQSGEFACADPLGLRVGSRGVFQFLAWSPNCAYAAVAVGSFFNNDTVVFDVTTGEAVGRVEDAQRGTHDVFWSPDSDYLVVDTRNGAFLWDISSNRQSFMEEEFFDRGRGESRAFERVGWDDTRNQVIAVLRGSGDVATYSLQNGARLAVYPNPDDNGSRFSHFFVSEDGSKIVVFTVRNGDYLAVYDRSSGRETRVDTNGFVTSRPTRVALSPDNRYLAVEYTHLRVWDLREDADDWRDRDPVVSNYIFPRSEFVSITDDNQVVSIGFDGFVYIRDLFSGELQ